MHLEVSNTNLWFARGKDRWVLEIPLLLVSGVLLMVGYIMMASASMHLGDVENNHFFHFPLHQLVHIVIGLFGMAVMMTIPLERLEKFGLRLFLFGLALSVAVLIPGLGVKVNGSLRWLSLGGPRVQVSEIVKLISVIYLAGYITRHVRTIRVSVYGMVPPLMLLSFACLLLLLEPDFGAAAVILVTALALLFLGGAKLWQFGVLVCLVSGLGMILIRYSPERMERFTTFMDPWADPLDSGFQLTQSLIAFGRGEWFGVGLGNGLQKLHYLPEGHTDFLFAVIGEELGLLGVSIVIALFALLVWKAFAIARASELAGYEFPAYLAYGLGIWFGVQAIINMGVNMGMMPTKGLTLPLMSYGGASMIVMCCAIGLLLRVHNETVKRSNHDAGPARNG